MIFKITPSTCELLDPKIEKSLTACKFENFDSNPAVDAILWALAPKVGIEIWKSG